MKILVLNGSPRKNGNTARLVAAFSHGATEAGHKVETADVARMNIGGCMGCEYCHDKERMNIGGCMGCEYCHDKEPGVCVRKDDMQAVYEKIKQSDMLVLASPIYYYTMTGQIISTLNRTYALGRLTNIKKTALILSSGSPNMYDAAIRQYQGVISWWGAKDMGIFTKAVQQCFSR